MSASDATSLSTCITHLQLVILRTRIYVDMYMDTLNNGCYPCPTQVIMGDVFSRIYWPLLMWEDDLDTAFESDHRHFKHDF